MKFHLDQHVAQNRSIPEQITSASKSKALDSKIQENQEQNYLHAEYACNSHTHQRSKSVTTSYQTSRKNQNIFISSILQYQQQQEISEETHKISESIFHNSHKHLITFLKRIGLPQTDLKSKPQGLKALKFWAFFKNLKSYNKSSLYLIFGVQRKHNIKNLLKLAKSSKQLSKILRTNSIEDIELAQRIMREVVVKQLSKYSLDMIKDQCKMEDSQFFYHYLQEIKEQLSEGELSVRMSKQQKKKFMQKQHRLIDDKKESRQ